MSGGVGPYTFEEEEYENGTFLMTELCYGNTSFSVTDANGCKADFILEFPFPIWCLMDNESSSSSSRDYWTLPDGMLPWLIAAAALVLVFVVAAFVACCCWSCLSERTEPEPKQKLLEQGDAKPASPDLSNAKVHDYDSDAEKAEKKKKAESETEPDEEEAKPADHDDDVQEKDKKKKKKKKKGERKKKDKKKKEEDKPKEPEPEEEKAVIDEHGFASGEDEEKKVVKKRKKKSKSKKHKALDEDEEVPQVELDEMM